jgi:predicted permease
METLLKNLRFGLRMLAKHPSLSIIAIVTFGLGIGLTTTVASIVSGVLFVGLPFEGSDRVVWLQRTNLTENIDRMGVSVHDFVDWREQQTTFYGIAAFDGAAVNLSDTQGRPERFTGGLFSAEMFDVLNMQPMLGRAFQEGEDRPGADPVIILGYDVWQDKFGGTMDILGRTVRANGVTRTVIGVMPEGFKFPALEEVWLPLEIDPSVIDRGEGPQYGVVGRLGVGTSLDEARAELATIAARIEQEYPESNEGVGAVVREFADWGLGSEVYALLFTMLGAAIGVLVIACVNVANLLLARTSLRTRELAVRTALGAGRGRLIAQLLTEVFVLALAGGALGVALGYGGIEWFVSAIAIDPPPFWITFGLDRQVMLFVIGATVLAAVVSGLAPALQASKTDINESLKDEGRGSSSLHAGRFTGALVVAEVAVSCGLLIAAGLMISSVVRLRTVDLPFTTENIITARINLPVLEYPDTTSRVQFYERLLPRLTAIPGGEAATLSDGLPASGNGSRVFEVEGETYEVDRDFPNAREGIVTPGYFETFHAEVLQGRSFSVADRQGNLPVAVVNQTFVRTFFPDGDAIGRRIRMGRRDDDAKWLTVIGVVPDMRMEGIGNNNASPAGFYIPIAQSGVGNFVSIALRTQGAPMAKTADVRATVMSIDPNLPIFDVLSMEEVIEDQTWFYRVFGTLFMAFGISALFLAAVGLYGVMSFAVARRTQEMGIRMALGAHGARLVGLLMRKGATQLAVGLGFGLGLAVLTAGPLQVVLFEVSARDPKVYGTVIGLLAIVGVLASLIPARRVSKVDPVAALTPE